MRGEYVGPNSGYWADAKYLQKDKKYLAALVKLIRKKSAINNDGHETIYRQLLPFIEDFGFGGRGSSEGIDADSKVRYMITNTRNGKNPWSITVFLAWLSVEDQLAATKFYVDAGLVAKGKPCRRYLGNPGDWAAKRKVAARKSASRANSTEREPGPIIPQDFELGLPIHAPRLGYTVTAAVRFPHPHGIRFADFSPCGKFIVVAGRKDESKGEAGIFKWNLENISATDQKIRIATRDDEVLSVTVSPDSRYVVASSGDEARVYYTTEMSEALFSIKHNDQISYCSYSCDGRKIASASHDKTVCVWNAHSGDEITTIKLELSGGHAVNSAYFSPDGTHLIIGCSNGSISIWNIGKNELVDSLELDSKDYDIEGVCGAIYSRDGMSVVSAGPGAGRAHIWDLTSPTKSQRVFGEGECHKDTIWSAEYSHDERFIVTASEDRYALIWDVRTRKVVTRLRHPVSLYVAHFSPDDKYVLTACDNGNVYLWKVG